MTATIIPVHKNLRFEFELGSQRFEAVGFLEPGEESVSGQDALRRCDNGQLLKTEEDWQFIYEHREWLPQGLQDHWLVTARPDPKIPRHVAHFSYFNAEWHGLWRYLNCSWYGTVLVLRRRVS